jgi:hypothetical protein
MKVVMKYRMSTLNSWISRSLLFLMILLLASDARAAGENIALHRSVTFLFKPNYYQSTDENDARQLTDGIYAPKTEGVSMWSLKETVGWQTKASPVTVTVDLETVQPISGVSYSTTGGAAEVGWPYAIFVTVSDDGDEFKIAGDLVRQTPNAPFGDGERRFRYVSNDLNAKGRYVRLMIVPRGVYTFCDEIEVHAGPDRLLDEAAHGDVVKDMEPLLRRLKTRVGIQNRLRKDIVAAEKAIAESTLSADKQTELKARLRTAEAQIPNLPEVDPIAGKITFPINDTHAEIHSVHGELVRSRGLPDIMAWQKNRYDPLNPNEAPDKPPAHPTLSIRMMKNEFRAESFLITNCREEALNFRITLAGMPQSPEPSWLMLSSVPWTDTYSGVPVAAALPPAVFERGGYRLSVPAGMTRKVWLEADSSKVEPGKYEGKLKLTKLDGSSEPFTQILSFDLSISKVAMQRPRLSLGMWDDADGMFFGTIRPSAFAIMRSHCIDSPWALRDTLPWPGDADFEGEKLRPLDFTRFDKWISEWPDARHYLVFANVPLSEGRFAGVAMGTEDFDRRVGLWARAIEDHLRALKVDPRKLGLLLLDEPSTEEQNQTIIAWMDAIKAGAPEIGIFTDPTAHRIDQLEHQQAITGADIVCPYFKSYLKGGPAVASFLEKGRQNGQETWFYSCSGPAKTLDPYLYYRMLCWQAFAHDATGVGYWCFGRETNSWNVYTAEQVPYSPAFFDPDTVTDGIHFQAIREGIQDYEYLAMLDEKAGQSANSAFRSKAQSLLREAVETIRQEYETADNKRGNYTAAYKWNNKRDRCTADRLRLRVLDLLEMNGSQP